MFKALGQGFSNATDLADYLVKKLNIPFRDVHSISGQLVKKAEDKNVELEELSLEEMQSICKEINSDVYDAIKLENSLYSRKSYGGTSPDVVKNAIAEAKQLLLILK